MVFWFISYLYVYVCGFFFFWWAGLNSSLVSICANNFVIVSLLILLFSVSSSSPPTILLLPLLLPPCLFFYPLFSPFPLTRSLVPVHSWIRCLTKSYNIPKDISPTRILTSFITIRTPPSQPLYSFVIVPSLPFTNHWCPTSSLTLCADANLYVLQKVSPWDATKYLAC